MKRYGTVIPALVTPFREDGSVDYEAVADLAGDLAHRGCDGFVVCGTTGESPVLSDHEKEELTRAVVGAVGGRAFVWAGAGSNDTAHSCQLARRLQAAGAEGIMAVTPYYNKPPQEGLYRHFRALADAVDVPVMIYNVPSRTGCNILPATVARLAAQGRVVAIKEASGNLDQVTELRRLLPVGFTIYSGDDALTLPMLALGAQGVVSVAAHLVPERLRRMVDSFGAGDMAAALAEHLALTPLFRALFVTSNPIPVKAALALLGRDTGVHRLPLVPPGEAELKVLREALAGLGLL
ncbi:MAG: 4-hydroxy-tetrahydrodipicolinate synthase [Clostridia bacterium]|nr:4-hydroxy-tetrahydrodipicolinate synthase [Clostridia bacterium]